ncbi:EthD domain-containing protein [Bordetella sp. 15P40C-2]|uniref:EthD domain-containing protein n=1 Tax=Bordetella sp. 15P40C-2 TaxID=2572246 RepID=UPI00136564E7|nr:EthD domain-containing protein [Bordetella sp. 15P40C-2]
MFKVVTLLKRRPGMSVQDFQRVWLHDHAARAAQVPGLRCYVQSHTLLQGYVKGERIYDGIGEMVFHSEDAYLAARNSDVAQRAQRDLAEFTDTAQTVIMTVDVHVIVDGAIPRDGVKNVEFVNCRPGMDLTAFRRYWREHHGPLASGIPGMRRYEQNHLRLAEYADGSTPRYDGLAITWFDSTADMKQGAQTEVYARTRADEARFLPDGHLPFIVTREHVIV